MPLPTYADGSLDAGRAAARIEELEGALRGVVAAWDEDESAGPGDFWDRMQPAIDQARAAVSEAPTDGPVDDGDDAYEDASPGKPRVSGSNEDDAVSSLMRFYCEPCGRWSDEAHDHTDDTVEPLIRPRGDY